MADASLRFYSAGVSKDTSRLMSAIYRPGTIARNGAQRSVT